MILREYQKKLIEEAADILIRNGIVYLTLETRVGKTPVSLVSAQRYSDVLNCKAEVFFLTKKSVIPSIHKTLAELGDQIIAPVTVMSFDSLHKLRHDPNRIYIIDEAHSFGSFPKPSLRAKNLRLLTKGCPVILLSATPSPESYSMLFHQLWACNANIWAEYKTFYKWAAEYVNVKQKRINAIQYVNDYSGAKIDMIEPMIKPIMISFTKEDAGFTHTDVKERIVTCKPSDEVVKMCKELKDNRIICWKAYTITADTAAGLMSKLHQLYSGTVIPDNHEGVEVSLHKLGALLRLCGEYRKLAVFYKFIAEREMLLKYLSPFVTEDAQEFEAMERGVFIGQYLSKREGIDLKSADATVFYTLDFAYLSYEQAKNRMQSYHRDTIPELIVLQTEGSLDSRIWKRVKAKKNFTASYFERMI